MPAVTPSTSEMLTAQVDAIRLAVVRLERKLRKHSGADVTPSQLSALVTLQRHGPMRPGELSEREQISKSTATGLIRRLEDKRLIHRMPDRADARSHLLDLTEQGLQLLSEAAERSNDYLRQRIGELDDDRLARLLDAIEALQQISGPPR